MVGTDIVHGLQYAGLLNAKPGPQQALPDVMHDLEQAGGGEPLYHGGQSADEQPVTTGEDLRGDPAFADARVTVWWSEDRVAAEKQAMEADVAGVAESLDALVERVDAGLVCTWSGATHAELALPFLKAGKPVFIDKPLVEDPREARELVAAAEAGGTFFFSSSPWKWSPSVGKMIETLPALGELRTVMVTGPAVHGPYFYVTHGVELLQRLVGPGASRVRCRSDESRHLIEVEQEDGTIGLINGLRGTRWIRHAVAYGEHGYLEADISNRDRDEGMVAMLRAFVEGVRTGSPPLPMAWGEEVVRILTAAERSAAASGGPVDPRQ